MHLISVTPSNLEQGTQGQVTIRGDGFNVGGDVSVVVSGTEVFTLSSMVVDDNNIVSTIEVAKLAEIGLRNLVVTIGTDDATFVNAIAITNFQSLTRQLRFLTGERVPPGKQDTDTNFSDDEMADIILRFQGNLYFAAAEIWSAKAAEAADMVDVTESGSEKKLSQLYKPAIDQATRYTQAGVSAAAALIEPVVGQSVDILGRNNCHFDLGLLDRYAGVDTLKSPITFLFMNSSWGPIGLGGLIAFGGLIV